MKMYNRIGLVIAATLPIACFASSSDSKIEDAARASYNYRMVLQDHVTVKSDDGMVTLTGTVQDKSEKALAEDTVSNLPGVVGVTNRIVVKANFEEHSDAWIALRIRTELLLKANVSATATKVAVDDGVVTLTGTAENAAQRELTEAYAKDVENVKSVRNDIVVQAPDAGTSKMGEAIDDASITSEVKFALLSHGSTSAVATKVTTVDSVVNISGVANSAAEKDLVTKLAQDSRGVKSVVNTMTIKS